jgi:hypothetical protein
MDGIEDLHIPDPPQEDLAVGPAVHVPDTLHHIVDVLLRVPVCHMSDVSAALGSQVHGHWPHNNHFLPLGSFDQCRMRRKISFLVFLADQLEYVITAPFSNK